MTHEEERMVRAIAAMFVRQNEMHIVRDGANLGEKDPFVWNPTNIEEYRSGLIDAARKALHE